MGVEEIYSKKLNKWLNVSNYTLDYHQDKVRNNQYTKNYLFYYNNKTDELTRDGDRVKYICDNCKEIHETSWGSYKKRYASFCLKCTQKIKSSDPEIKGRKRQAVLNRDLSIREKQREKMKSPKINTQRIKKFKETMKNKPKEEKEKTRLKKQETWSKKSAEEIREIIDKRMESGALWKSIKTKFGEIKVQGYEDKAIIKLLELDVDCLSRGPPVKLDNGHWHFPDLYIEKGNKKIIVEVKSGYTYDKDPDEIQYKKEQTLKKGIVDYYFIWIFGQNHIIDTEWIR